MSGPAQETPFASIIEEHLELKRRNSQLDRNMPLDRYRVEDPFRNHPLFKTEEQARIEDTLGGTELELGLNGSTVLAWPFEESEPDVTAHGQPDQPDEQPPVESLWGRSRDFDWGD